MHLPFLHELPEFELVAICDLSPTVLSEVGDRYCLKQRFEHYQDLVAGDLDAVIVATTHHAEPALSAIDAGKHLMVEKPLALEPAEAWELATAAATANTVAMVGYMWRYDPGYEYGAARIAEMPSIRCGRVHDFGGRFGWHSDLFDLASAGDVSGAVRQEWDLATERAAKAAIGNDHAGYASLYIALLTLASHDFAALRGAFGEPTEIVNARAIDGGTLLATLDCERTLCTFEMSAASEYEWWDQTLTAYGDHETIAIEFPNPWLAFAPTVVRIWGSTSVAGEQALTPSNDAGFRRELQHLAYCIRTGQSPRTPLAMGAKDVELAVNMIRSLPPRPADNKHPQGPSDGAAA